MKKKTLNRFSCEQNKNYITKITKKDKVKQKQKLTDNRRPLMIYSFRQ